MKKGTIKIIVIAIIIAATCYFILSNVLKNNTMAYSEGETCTICHQGTLTYKTKNCKRGLWCAYCQSFYGGTTSSHSYGSWEITKEATCTATGKKARKCSVCYYLDTQEIPKKSHNKPDSWTTSQYPSCTSEGKKVKKCTVCGTTLQEEAIPKSEHMLSQWSTTKQPTCTEKGQKTSDCSVCFQVFYKDIPATGHNESDTWTTIQYPTCAIEGKKVKKCLTCGDILQEQTIEKYEHMLSPWSTSKQPTCTKKGTKTRDCSVCFQMFNEDIPALGHDLSDDDWTVSDPGTCQEKGKLIRYCRRTDTCDYSEEKEGEYGGHTFGDWQIYIYGDCYTKRVMRRYCGNGMCKEMEEEIGDVIHPYTIEEVIKEATCIEDGEMKITCTQCKAVEYKPIKSAGSHNMKLTPDKDHPGEHYLACTVCGIKDTENSSWNDPCQYKITNVTPIPKYCTDIVTMEYTCECGYSYTKQEQFLPHHSTAHDGGVNIIKKPTCVEPGYCTYYCGVELVEGVKCMYEYDGQEIPINLDAHNEKWVPVKGASKDQCICTICNEVLMTQNCIPKDQKTKHYPTCISDGYEIYHCQICDRTIGEPDFSTNLGKALGHDYKDGITCSRCSHQIEEVESLTYEINNTYISDISSQTSIEAFMNEIITDADEAKVYKADDTIADEQEIISTGMKIVSKSGDRTSTLTAVVKGDSNGDGKADFVDMIISNKARLGEIKLENEFFKAADVNNDEKNDIRDLVKINRFRLKRIEEL